MPKPAAIDDELMAKARAERARFLAAQPQVTPMLVIGERMKSTQMFVDTLDIADGADFKADICDYRSLAAAGFKENAYETVVIQEVLEHTLFPASALENIRALMKPGGLLIGSTPLNARIHGPLPDLWRWTIHGLRAELVNWDDVRIEAIESDRPLFPAGYNFTARCQKVQMRYVGDMKRDREP